jgi:hypothetical protein
MSSSDIKVDTRRREMRPERINIGDDELVRNDLIAREQGTCEKTVDRGDRKGAPYTYVGGVKYRPIKAYRKFLAAQVRIQSPPSERRSRRAQMLAPR